MSDMSSDPIRLMDDPASGPALRGDLGVATGASVAGLDMAGGLAALKASVAAQAGTTGVVAPVGAAAGMSTLSKVAIAGALVLGGVAAWIGLRSPDPEPVQAPTVGQASVEVQEQPRQLPPQPAIVPEAPKPAAVVPLAPEEVPEEEVDDADVVIEPAAPHAKKHKTPRKKAEPPSVEDVRAEASLVDRAKTNLSGSPSKALELANQAKREFPNGMLVEEREAIAVQALAKLGRSEQAKQRGERFLSRFARGAHASAVRSALERL